MADVPLAVGDTLVLVVGQDFDKRNNLARNFVVVGRRQVQKFTDARKGWLATAAFVAVIGLSAVGLVDFLKALLVLLALFLLLGYAKPADLRRQMPYQIIAIIAPPISRPGRMPARKRSAAVGPSSTAAGSSSSATAIGLSFLGRRGGCIGETCAPALLAGAALVPHAAARWAWSDDHPIHALWSRNRDPDGGASLAGLAWRGEGVLVTRPARQAGCSRRARQARSRTSGPAR